MRKITVIVLSILLVLSMTACGNNDQNDTQTPAENQITTPAEDQTAVSAAF